jgi:hypothetical protein
MTNERSMFRCLAVIISFSILVGYAGHAQAQLNVAPLYSLPRDGAWAEFDFECKDRAGKDIRGTMRISSTGRIEIRQVGYRWIEIKIEGDGVKTRYGKILVEEEALLKGEPFEDHILVAYHQEGKNAPVLQYSGAQITRFFTMGIRGRLKQGKTEDEVATAAGPFKCKQVESGGHPQVHLAVDNDKKEQKPANQRTLAYRAWLSDGVPFGVVKFEVWSTSAQESTDRRVFVAQFSRSGQGARSEVITPPFGKK